MTPHQVVVVCIRLVALVWLLYVVNHSYGLFAYVSSNTSVALNKSVVWFFALLQIATSGVMWFFATSIAAWLLPSLRPTQSTTPPALVQWQTLGVICVGLWSLSRSIPDTVYWVTFYNMAESTGVSTDSLSAEQKASFFSTVVELVLGLWLLFGAKGFAAFLYKARTVGLKT